MKIYTKTGDAGDTGLYGGGRVSKDHYRISAYGCLDELNAFLGLLICSSIDDDSRDLLSSVQHELFSIGAELATVDPHKYNVAWNGDGPTKLLENKIDQWDSALPPLKTFILPGGTLAASYCHVARTVCRRCEREVVRFSKSQPDADVRHLIIYLNRLSDLLFVLARRINHLAAVPDVLWRIKQT
jgi:cob(I)alamin adenosyltransferase